jgi:hypothetical protein
MRQGTLWRHNDERRLVSNDQLTGMLADEVEISRTSAVAALVARYALVISSGSAR